MAALRWWAQVIASHWSSYSGASPWLGSFAQEIAQEWVPTHKTGAYETGLNTKSNVAPNSADISSLLLARYSNVKGPQAPKTVSDSR